MVTVFLRTHQPCTGTEVLMGTKLERIAEISATTPKPEFTSLYHLINAEMLMQCHKELDGKKAAGIDRVLFVTLPTPNYPKILQIKRRYSIIHSDEYYVRLFYPVPSVIILKPLSTKEAGTSPFKVWFSCLIHTP